jgi:viroplasmin and RNaseH domain-containing protein
MKAKKKVYAIKNPINKIVTSWEECNSIIKGNPYKFKSFLTWEDAT